MSRMLQYYRDLSPVLSGFAVKASQSTSVSF